MLLCSLALSVPLAEALRRLIPNGCWLPRSSGDCVGYYWLRRLPPVVVCLCGNRREFVKENGWLRHGRIGQVSAELSGWRHSFMWVVRQIRYCAGSTNCGLWGLRRLHDWWEPQMVWFVLWVLCYMLPSLRSGIDGSLPDRLSGCWSNRNPPSLCHFHISLGFWE